MSKQSKQQPPPRNRDLKCKNAQCDKPVLAKGYCRTHYRRMERGGNPDEPALREKRVIEVGVARFRPEVAGAIFVDADLRGISAYEMLQIIADEWYERRKTAAAAPAKAAAKRAQTPESGRVVDLATGTLDMRTR